MSDTDSFTPPSVPEAPPPPPQHFFHHDDESEPAEAAPPRSPAEPRVTRRVAAVLLVGGLLVGGGLAYGATRLQEGSSTVHIAIDNTPVKAPTSNAEGVARQLVPAVGTIIARQPSSTTASLGSGFGIAHGGGATFLLTNNHVVTGSSDLHVVMPNGDAFTATLVGTDTLDDLAVLSVPNDSLPLATFGDSAQLVTGQTVIAIGSPLGNQSSVTAGVISALHRTISASGENSTSSETLEDVLQTDASINPGNSGGPLVDVEGRVVGVNVAIAGNSTNIGYSIPSNLARQVAAALMSHQKVPHPFLGIGYLDQISAIESSRGFSGPGVLITTVSPGTPASQAGVQTGDILVAIDGVNIDNGETLGGLIQSKQVGQTLTLSVRRGGSNLTLHATLEERPAGT
ncbi:MAG: trypsin-like peptidase domain-containing protein [Candidatus Dormibacteraeota bacterium]|nr:trypsin-like peptidase domain-containing protein [Candidatus Dormibacteraeota bacterium]MBV9525818.1 trypsin-like peptidase domain-containing protein [Candidatus Dormibacteraeota bacterium]